MQVLSEQLDSPISIELTRGELNLIISALLADLQTLQFLTGRAASVRLEVGIVARLCRARAHIPMDH